MLNRIPVTNGRPTRRGGVTGQGKQIGEEAAPYGAASFFALLKESLSNCLI